MRLCLIARRGDCEGNRPDFSAQLTPERLGGTTTIGSTSRSRPPPGRSRRRCGADRPALPAKPRYRAERPRHRNVHRAPLETARAARAARRTRSWAAARRSARSRSARRSSARAPRSRSCAPKTRTGTSRCSSTRKGISPVEANIVFPGELLPSRRPYGGDISIAVPLVPSLPEAPDVAVVALGRRSGPVGLTYYEQAHGANVPYTPRRDPPARQLPPRPASPSPQRLAFDGGQRSLATTRVRCPAGTRARRAHIRRRG